MPVTENEVRTAAAMHTVELVDMSPWHPRPIAIPRMTEN